MTQPYTDEQWNDMVDLLTYISAADRRTVGNTDVRVWLDAAADAGWPSMRAAYRAVIRHRNEQPGKWLEPGHITAQLERVRQLARATYRAPDTRDVPMDVLSDPQAYRRYMNDRVAAHHAACLEAFERGEPLALEAAT